MDLEEKLQSARVKLARIKEQREIDLQKYKQELAQREAQRERADTLEGFRTWVTSYETNSAKHIESLETEIADLEAHISTEEYQTGKRARANLEAMKEPARVAWLKYGGLDEDFEGTWPRIKRDLLIRQVLEELAVMMEMDRA